MSRVGDWLAGLRQGPAEPPSRDAWAARVADDEASGEQRDGYGLVAPPTGRDPVSHLFLTPDMQRTVVTPDGPAAVGCVRDVSDDYLREVADGAVARYDAHGGDLDARHVAEMTAVGDERYWRHEGARPPALDQVESIGGRSEERNDDRDNYVRDAMHHEFVRDDFLDRLTDHAGLARGEHFTPEQLAAFDSDREAEHKARYDYEQAMAEAGRDRAERADPNTERLVEARDQAAAGGRFEEADSSQRVIDYVRQPAVHEMQGRTVDVDHRTVLSADEHGAALREAFADRPAERDAPAVAAPEHAGEVREL